MTSEALEVSGADRKRQKLPIQRVSGKLEPVSGRHRAVFAGAPRQMGVAAETRSAISTRISFSISSLSSLTFLEKLCSVGWSCQPSPRASVNRKSRTVNLRLFSGQRMTILIAAAGCLSLVGCATTYTVNSLPRDYAAHPESDFSMLNLSAWAQPITSKNEIRHGDRLQLRLNSGAGGEDSEQTWSVGVNELGEATLPNIGRVRLAGLSTSEAEQTIVNESVSRDIYLTPAVDLRLEERQTYSVMVTGAVNAPGPLEFHEPSLTLADVIVRAGGLTSAATGQIIVNQATSTWESGDQLTAVSHTTTPDGSLQVDLSTTSAEELAAIRIPPGSTIGIAASRPRTIRVIGVIRNREIEVPPGRNMRLLDALAIAGGPTYSDWVSSRVDIIRRVPGENETVRIRASIRRAKKDNEHNLLLAADDIVSVEENPFTFTLSTLGGLTGLTNFSRAAIP